MLDLNLKELIMKAGKTDDDFAKSSVIAAFLKFSPPAGSDDEKHLMRFVTETPPKFKLRRSARG